MSLATSAEIQDQETQATSRVSSYVNGSVESSSYARIFDTTQRQGHSNVRMSHVLESQQSDQLSSRTAAHTARLLALKARCGY